MIDRLPDIIKQHSAKKPILIFCSTRKATQITAKLLADRWKASPRNDRMWYQDGPVPQLHDVGLKGKWMDAFD